ncbi:MAG: hypothetical protein NTY75_03430, partial [Candidatus Shapirobacteria bacterium]|nr:hypothetical protein [Candidatus Shapirobacteria bacterium]
ELQSLLEKNGLTEPQFLAQTLDVYLDLIDHISQNHEFSTGHDRKHLGRDMTATLEIFQDAYQKNLCAHPSDLFCGAIGASHNNSVGLIPRYEDFAHLATG